MKRINIRPGSWLLILALVVISGCKKEPSPNLPHDPVEIPLTANEALLIESGNGFAFDIFRQVLAAEDGSTNIMISPLSISYALSMTLNGASGTTREAMLETLKINNISIDELNSSYKTLTSELTGIDSRVLMRIANSVWIENDFIVKKYFTDILSRYYNAEQKQFEISDPAVPGKINTWIESKTNGLIKKMVESLNDNTVMLIINAIYFKGKWKLEFDPSETEHESFSKLSGVLTQVPMMKQKDDFRYFRGQGLKVAEFPYGQGNYVMDVILPDEESALPADLLSEDSFTSWITGLQMQELNLSLPRFKYGYKKGLKEILTDMGMGIAFTDGADFTNMADTPPLLINDVTHQTFIETNEEGTEAAAVTIVDVGTTSAGPDPIEFKADHPFYYIIREISTNTIIFMGRVSDPLAE